MGFAKWITTGEFSREGSVSRLVMILSETASTTLGSFAAARNACHNGRASISFDHGLIKREGALEDSIKLFLMLLHFRKKNTP